MATPARGRARLAVLVAVLGAACAGPSASADSLSFELTGVKSALRRQLLKHLDAALGPAFEDISPGRIQALHRRAPASLGAALEALGYYRATITPSIEQDADAWRASYRVTLGDPVRVAALRVELTGAAGEDPELAGQIDEFPLATGEVFRHERYEAGKRQLERRLSDRGYFDAAFVRHEVLIDPAAGTAHIALVVDSGHRYRYGPVRWPDTVLAEDFLNRFVDFQTGAPYVAEDLLTLQSRLTDSNYFTSVTVEPRSDLAAGDRVPIDITLTPRKAQRYSFGLGFGTDTGPRARAAWQRPYINARGHRLDADLRLSPVLSSLSGGYTIPLMPAHTNALSITTSLLQENTDVSDSTRLQFGAAHLAVRHGWQETLALDYEVERFDVGNETETSRLLIPSGRWLRTWADNRIDTRRGLRLGMSLRGAQSALLSGISFAQLRVDGKFIHAIGRTRLITRAELGATAISDFDRLPVTQRFFAGGDNSLRGFDFRSLGPRNSAGKVVGGRYLALGSVELEQEIRGPWRAAVFSDFGNAVNSWSDPMAYSVGIGVRWLSPVGLVRVDVANGVTEDDRSWRLHVIVGPDL